MSRSPRLAMALPFMSNGKKGPLEISIARDMPAVKMVVECYKTVRDVFDGFVKDFVREHLYPHIREYVPSSTRQGRDALYKRSRRTRNYFAMKKVTSVRWSCFWQITWRERPAWTRYCDRLAAG